MDYTILRDWLHREHPDAALLRDEAILSAAQRIELYPCHVNAICSFVLIH
ncbi:MAG: hypothetical protein ACLRYE_03005 [Gemmiger formicilis]